MDYTKFRLRNFSRLDAIYLVECGSLHELPTKYSLTNRTDADFIFYYYDVCAIPWNRNPPRNTECVVLRIESKQTPPGFARLIVDRNNTKDNPTYFRRPPFLKNIQTGGPSWPHAQRLTHEGRAVLNVNENAIMKDLVLAVCCPYWPVEAEEWRKRKRYHGWPNEKLIARITRGGCHFVSKLRTWSSCDDTEWRFSFSKAELLLIHSWTPDQKFAYHAIRVIKRQISESYVGDGSKALQTYYFKTLMLWACEEFPLEFWDRQHAKTYLEVLFRRFVTCLYENYCPNYFIPDCNIMSHLKDEGNFENQLQMILKILNKEISILLQYVNYSIPKDIVAIGDMPFECGWLIRTQFSLPLSEELNGRVAQYLSECEWFLAEMKNLHAAIDAHLRLMYVDSVTERQASKDYGVCLENFYISLLKREEFESCDFLNVDISGPQNWITTFIRKVLRNSVTIYRRADHPHATMIKESYPSLFQSVTSAYRANFYFTAMQSYKKSLRECKKCFEVLHSKAEAGLIHQTPSSFSFHIPILICNSLSQIFDEHLQVILGFATLHRNICFSKSTSISTHEVCLKLDAWEFLKYIYIQCNQKLYSISGLTDNSFAINLDSYKPYASQLVSKAPYGAAILFAALRQSRAFKSSLRGVSIPDHLSQGKYRMI